MPNDVLRHEREKRGWSQSRLAELLGADTSMISRWECGDRKPDPLYQEKLCDLFGKDAIELKFVDPPASQNVISIPSSPHNEGLNSPQITTETDKANSPGPLPSPFRLP